MDAMKLPCRPALGLAVALPLLAACSEAPAPGTVVAASQQDPAAPAPADPAPAARATLQLAGVAEDPEAEGVLTFARRDGEQTDGIAVLPPLLDLEVARAELGVDAVGYPAVMVSPSAESRKVLHEFTARHVDRQVAVIVDGVVVSAPVVSEPIAGDFQIAGRFSEAEARDLARRLVPADR